MIIAIIKISFNILICLFLFFIILFAIYVPIDFFWVDEKNKLRKFQTIIKHVQVTIIILILLLLKNIKKTITNDITDYKNYYKIYYVAYYFF